MVPAKSIERAPQVCSHCKSIKKGCDKRLPSCSQCIKRRAVCRYGEPEDGRRSRSETSSPQGRHERLAPSLASIPRSVQSTFPPNIRVSLLLASSLSDILPANVAGLELSRTFPSPDNVVRLQVTHVIGVAGRKAEEIIFRFFRGVHTWLPIISRIRFRERYIHFQSSPAADFSVLLLTMRLLIQHPSPDPTTDQDREFLYLATKALFAQVQTFIPSSLFLVQAGVILGHYERAHGLVEAAYVTVGTCARMACAMNMQNKQCSGETQGSDAWVEDEEVLCTWWGLVILDRAITCDSQMAGRPLATRPIREDDYLPLDRYDLDRNTEDAREQKLRYFVSATSLRGLGTFGREAQSAFLFDRARIVIESGDAQNIYEIARELQSLLGVLMEQIGGKWGIYCGATQMLISGLYNIHQAARMHAGINSLSSYQETTDAAINTLTRMMIDIAYAFNRTARNFDIETLHPAIAHIVTGAHQHVITAENYNDPIWREEFSQIQRLLNFFKRRWGFAELELKRLNETMEMSMSLRT